MPTYFAFTVFAETIRLILESEKYITRRPLPASTCMANQIVLLKDSIRNFGPAHCRLLMDSSQALISEMMHDVVSLITLESKSC